MAVLGVTCRMALKEWAVAQRALDQGRQILLLRKGGIREPGKEFRVLYPEFLLYPSFEHQRSTLIKEGWQEALADTVAQAPGPDRVTFSHFARVFQAIELMEQSTLEILDPHHIWTPDYAQKRLHWKPRKPLAVMLVRVYRLEQPPTVPVLPEYSGCTSWVPLVQDVPLGQLIPVLSDSAFLQQAAQVQKALEKTVVPA